jgi:glycosyltransferase involved in cell wall biosynthesis
LDIAHILGIPAERIRVAPNPTVTTELERLAGMPLDDPWFAPNEPPVVLGVGRLEPQKDFPNLLRAFALLKRVRPCRLIVLGEGKEREALARLAVELGIERDFKMPGFVENPYAYMTRASLFVLSSRWEGSPNGLTEALALGTPLVATDCPDGPREILEDGKHGPLVPVGNTQALACAMQQVLANPPAREPLRAAGLRYTLERSADAYIEALGLGT